MVKITKLTNYRVKLKNANLFDVTSSKSKKAHINKKKYPIPLNPISV